MDIVDVYVSFFRSIHINIPEAVMFICFGFSWPVSVIKALRTKKVTGKSPLFMVLIIIGYLSGIAHKTIFSRDILIVLYLLNLLMIITDLCLYLRYHIREHDEATPDRTMGIERVSYALRRGFPQAGHPQATLHSCPPLIVQGKEISI